MRAMRLTAGAATLLTVVGIAASGCSNEDAGDTGTTTNFEKPWDPCTLSDETLRKATIDPATQDPGLAAETPWEESCGWKTYDDTGVIMTALSTATVDQYRSNPDTTDFRKVTVGDRSAVTFRTDSDEKGNYCHLLLPFNGDGLVQMQVSRSPFTKETTPMCEVAVRIGDVVVAEMP